MSPTFEVPPRARRDYRRLAHEQRRAFDQARRRFVEGLRAAPPRFDPALRVKRVQGHRGVWELTFASDGRATFEYGAEQRPGEEHVVWRRIGDHSILKNP